MHQLKKQRTFWKEILGKKIQRSEEAYGMKNQCEKNTSMEYSPI
jgi:hypothetical protein